MRAGLKADRKVNMLTLYLMLMTSILPMGSKHCNSDAYGKVC